MFRRIFIDHPRSVGESYWQQFRVAGSFGVTMIGGLIVSQLLTLFSTPVIFLGFASLSARLQAHRERAAATGAAA